MRLRKLGIITVLMASLAVTVGIKTRLWAEAPAPTTLPVELTAQGFDFKAFLGDYPADDSRQHLVEIDRLLTLQDQRTPADVRRVRQEENMNVFDFADVLGPWFTPENVPYTAALLKEAARTNKSIHGAAKLSWLRKRPQITEPRLKPCLPLEKNSSYPSGHAALGAMWSNLLAEMFPENAEIILARGRQIGTDRELAGMHWPSDVEAGLKLGTEVAHRMLADPDFKAKLQKAREECIAAMNK
jgi:acid phosphatase (class A)